MILQALAFYVFAFVVMASAAMVVVSRNPVYSVLFLILAFFNAAALFVLIGAEFIAMIGAIVLTLRTRPGVRRQRISEQLYRPTSDAVTVVKVRSGEGV